MYCHRNLYLIKRYVFIVGYEVVHFFDHYGNKQIISFPESIVSVDYDDERFYFKSKSGNIYTSFFVVRGRLRKPKRLYIANVTHFCCVHNCAIFVDKERNFYIHNKCSRLTLEAKRLTIPEEIKKNFVNLSASWHSRKKNKIWVITKEKRTLFDKIVKRKITYRLYTFNKLLIRTLFISKHRLKNPLDMNYEKILLPHDLEFKHIERGFMYSIFITSRPGKIIAYGKYHELFPQDIKTNKKRLYQTVETTKLIKAGPRYILFVFCNKIIFCGNFGIRDNSIPLERCHIHSPDGTQIVKLATCTRMFFFITIQGNLYACGLGTRDKRMKVKFIKHFYLDDNKFKKIPSGFCDVKIKCLI